MNDKGLKQLKRLRNRLALIFAEDKVFCPKEVKAAAMNFFSTINGIITLLVEIMELSLGLQKDSYNNPIIFDEIKDNPFRIEINYDNIFDPDKKIYMTIYLTPNPLFGYFKGYGNPEIRQNYFSALASNEKVQLSAHM